MLVIQTILCKQNLEYVINSLMVDQGIPKLQQIEKEMELDRHRNSQGRRRTEKLRQQSANRMSEKSCSPASKRFSEPCWP